MIRMAESELGASLKKVFESIKIACQKRAPEVAKQQPRLVAVSKTKPKQAIIEAYGHGQRHFGENYVQELIEKAHDPEIVEKCSEIKWHLIGHLQRNKVPKVVSIPNLYMVETVDSEKLAGSLDLAWCKLEQKEKLRILVQVNTSGEQNKSGVGPGQTEALVSYILDHCPNLKFIGLMTIGAYEVTAQPNPDFKCLVECRKKVCDNLGLNTEEVELSMGMSHDYEHAIEMGSTNVRVGSLIFGARDYSKKDESVDSLTTAVDQSHIST